MKVLTKDLTGPALRWAVAQIEGHQSRCPWMIKDGWKPWQSYEEACGSPIPLYDEDWGAGGPITEREHISLSHFMADPMHIEPYVIAAVSSDYATQDSRWCAGPTPLIAAMRCYVVNKLGGTVDIPEELIR